MKQSELDAAVKVVRDVVYAKMQEKGFAQYIPELEKQVDVVDVVRYGLQAAEDERKRIETEDLMRSGLPKNLREKKK